MTPRPYLSWSQMNLLERSPEKYREVYINGMPSFSNAAMGFGSKVGKELEDDESSGDAAHDFVLSQMPRLSIAEYEIHAVLASGRKGSVPLIAKLDSASGELDDIIEYKTGKAKWTKAKVDKADQLTFYATVAYLKTRRIPRRLRLVWAETEILPDGTVRFTGNLYTFETRRDMGDVLRMMKRMCDAWALIQKMTEAALV